MRILFQTSRFTYVVYTGMGAFVLVGAFIAVPGYASSFGGGFTIPAIGLLFSAGASALVIFITRYQLNKYYASLAAMEAAGEDAARPEQVYAVYQTLKISQWIPLTIAIFIVAAAYVKTARLELLLLGLALWLVVVLLFPSRRSFCKYMRFQKEELPEG